MNFSRYFALKMVEASKSGNGKETGSQVVPKGSHRGHRHPKQFEKAGYPSPLKVDSIPRLFL